MMMIELENVAEFPAYIFNSYNNEHVKIQIVCVLNLFRTFSTLFGWKQDQS